MRTLSVLISYLLSLTEGASVGTAPQKCPVQNGNLLDIDLFVDSDQECAGKCQRNEKCFFYFFYTAPTMNRQPPQCFLYETCDRHVESAQPDCYISKENVVRVLAFVEKEEECVISCSENDMCRFYKVE